MKRVRAADVLVLLHQDRDPARHITAATLRKWVQRGHITRGAGGYDLAEILAYLDTRIATKGTEDLIPGTKETGGRSVRELP